MLHIAVVSKKVFFSLCTEGIGPIGKVPLFAVTSGSVGDLIHIPACMLFYGMAECLGIISFRHHSVCECVRRDLRFLIALALIALALRASRSLALLQVGLWSWDSPIPCKPGGEVDNGPHPRVGGFVPGRGAALSLRSRIRVE